jgi:hypothetical protein
MTTLHAAPVSTASPSPNHNDDKTSKIKTFRNRARVTIFARWNDVETPVAHAEVHVGLIIDVYVPF